ncbi:MAG: hypothetical protein IPK13_01265 [Deltaproteobacteria bacterium]|nr:hypothetical protein [Deltaproteobacteria bacterium]
MTGALLGASLLANIASAHPPHYEEVVIGRGDTLSELACAYGYAASHWRAVWRDPKNRALRIKRRRPDYVRPGDELHVRIPWRIRSTALELNASKRGVRFTAARDGHQGSQLQWVQTVDRSNQPIKYPGFDAPRLVVDPSSPPDDGQPFYYTHDELLKEPALRQKFSDAPARHAPSKAMGTTKWRALLSIGVVTGKRVTVLDTHSWGFNKDPDGQVIKIPARRATPEEIKAHLDILREGFGVGGDKRTPIHFKDEGWTFRQ